ncbi:hypothetical protein [Pseudoxanthomonas japonensis]|uniref:hypothetical protein n=1 Tax=Pseudoxanthomonas japonensis TaxID=69284 RepID=UPI003749D5C4
MIGFLIFAALLAITFGIVGVWNAGVKYGDAKRLQAFKAHAMVADELHRARARRKAGAA